LDAEQALLQRLHRLEESALAEVFDMYYPPLYRYVYHHVGHVETAEDLTAEIFQRLLEHLSTGRGPRRLLKPWLFRVAHNIVVDDARRQAHRNHQPLDARLPQSNMPPVEEQARLSLLAAEARRALRELTPKQRAVIVMKYLSGMSNVEVAHTLTLPVGAVKSLQHRGLASLRRILSQTAWTFVEDDAP
jgi:RNA polymerase sigma-70 factor (ECF subfamily)